jgi:hypothetical protein
MVMTGQYSGMNWKSFGMENMDPFASPKDPVFRAGRFTQKRAKDNTNIS